MRALLVVLATLACAGGDETMAAPRGILNSQERVLAHRAVVSPQQALYARPAYSWPATAESIVGFALGAAAAADTPLYVSRVKGIFETARYAGAGVLAGYGGLSVSDQTITIVLCVTSVQRDRILFKEIARGSIIWPAAVPVGGMMRVPFDSPVDLNPTETYAIGVAFKTSAAAGFAKYEGTPTTGSLTISSPDTYIDGEWDGEASYGRFSFATGGVLPYIALLESVDDQNANNIKAWY